ncbi:MAG: hypothetical protein AAFX03_12545 [Pseudomonadota bacterium]
MTGFSPFDGLAVAAIAIAVALSAIVSLVGSSTRKRAVAEARATAQDLAELTGILDPKELLQAFGPPDMDRVWRSVTMAEVRAKTRPLGHLISGDLVDWACIGLAALAITIGGGYVVLALWAAAAAQITGWVLAARLPR